MDLKSAENALMQRVDWFSKSFDDGNREHLGASVIGKPCERQIWMNFRWCYMEEFLSTNEDGSKEDHHGRMQRLFKRGHSEEDRIIELLRGAGCKVYDRDESQPKDENGDYPQFKISDIDGHFGGSLDGIVVLPQDILGGQTCLLEMKSYNEKSFKKLKEAGVGGITPYGPFKHEHVVQFSTYGWYKQLKYVVYFALAKNDDDIKIQIKELDWGVGQAARNRALKIITSQTPPERPFKSTSDFNCKYCGGIYHCWFEHVSNKNCRSCKFASPTADKRWLCNNYGELIPPEYVEKGCDNWSDILEGHNTLK